MGKKGHWFDNVDISKLKLNQFKSNQKGFLIFIPKHMNSNIYDTTL